MYPKVFLKKPRHYPHLPSVDLTHLTPLGDEHGEEDGNSSYLDDELDSNLI